MNTRDLEYLLAVADLKNFGKAAKACHVSQPALSMQLKKLEEQLGVTLFERTTKRVLITAAGEELVRRAKRIVQEVAELKEVGRVHQNPLAGELRFGAFPTLAPYFLPKLVPVVQTALPDLKLLLVEEKTDQLLARLKAGKLDAALLATPIEESGLMVEPLFEDRFVLAVPSKHPLAQKTNVRQADIAQTELLLLEEGHCLRDQALDVCRLMGSNEQQDFRATSLETLRQMVAVGVGMTLMPELAVRETPGIAYIPFVQPVPQRTIALVWRATSVRQQCLQQVANLAKAVGGVHA